MTKSKMKGKRLLLKGKARGETKVIIIITMEPSLKPYNEKQISAYSSTFDTDY